jgi:hypothetical protein
MGSTPFAVAVTPLFVGHVINEYYRQYYLSNNRIHLIFVNALYYGTVTMTTEFMARMIYG